MGHTDPMHIRMAALALLLILVGACRQPGDTPVPGGPAAPAPGGSPVAPAIEPGQPTPERPIDLPGSLVAPAIEPEPTGPDPTIDFDPG